tara:strand:+ start:4867 stop:5649 length:783 start_codon:yes stop_codon:yes gene_type:complete
MFINDLNPVAFNFFDFEIRWYSLAYIFGLIFAFQYGKYLIKKNSFFSFKKEILDDFLPYAILGIILGGRLGYIIFYDLFYYLNNPIKIFYIWQGGMSFHGGLIGIILISYYFVNNKNIQFLEFTDLLAIITPIGLFLGRIANFVNSELLGIPGNVPWSVIFIKIDNIPRHPSQIYEALLEGMLLFLILNIIFKYKKIKGYISSFFIILYSLFRIISEQFRLPDAQIGYIFSFYSMGTILSFIMLIAGLIIFFHVKYNKQS